MVDQVVVEYEEPVGIAGRNSKLDCPLGLPVVVRNCEEVSIASADPYVGLDVFGVYARTHSPDFVFIGSGLVRNRRVDRALVDDKHDRMFEHGIHGLTSGRTVFQLDGFTNVDEVADLFIKNQICFFGDVHPATLAFGKPEEVYDRVIYLRRTFGDGLILSSGCGAPWNMKLENIDAFVEAARTPNF